MADGNQSDILSAILGGSLGGGGFGGRGKFGRTSAAAPIPENRAYALSLLANQPQFDPNFDPGPLGQLSNAIMPFALAGIQGPQIAAQSEAASMEGEMAQLQLALQLRKVLAEEAALTQATAQDKEITDFLLKNQGQAGVKGKIKGKRAEIQIGGETGPKSLGAHWAERVNLNEMSLEEATRQQAELSGNPVLERSLALLGAREAAAAERPLKSTESSQRTAAALVALPSLMKNLSDTTTTIPDKGSSMISEAGKFMLSSNPATAWFSSAVGDMKPEYGALFSQIAQLKAEAGILNLSSSRGGIQLFNIISPHLPQVGESLPNIQKKLSELRAPNSIYAQKVRARVPKLLRSGDITQEEADLMYSFFGQTASGKHAADPMGGPNIIRTYTLNGETFGVDAAGNTYKQTRE